MTFEHTAAVLILVFSYSLVVVVSHIFRTDFSLFYSSHQLLGGAVAQGRHRVTLEIILKLLVFSPALDTGWIKKEGGRHIWAVT